MLTQWERLVFQVTDVDIDKINKPYLPIAAGELSKFTAKVVVLVSLALGLAFAAIPSAPYASSALTTVLLSSALLGTSYSLPPLRLKRFPLLAALCIIAVRGSIVRATHPVLTLFHTALRITLGLSAK